MNRPRRQFLRLAAGAAVLPASSRFGWAQLIRPAQCASSSALPRGKDPTSPRA